MRLALAQLLFPSAPADALARTEAAIAEAARAGASLVCFPEAYIPGYRATGRPVPPPDAAFLDHAWTTLAGAAARAGITVIVGTERLAGTSLLIAALVLNPDGSRAGFQDKVQLDPSEDEIYTSGAGRRVFTQGDLTFGISICHEGFRYPETVRWSAQHGAQVVFHPHLSEREPGGYIPTSFADPANSFHEKAMLCRAAENTCFFASVNYAIPGSPTTSAVIRPDGTLLCHQPYGQNGLLLADITPEEATNLLARRYKPVPA